MKIFVDESGRPTFPLKIFESNLLLETLADFPNYYTNKHQLIAEVLDQPVTRRCYIYLLWMYLSLKLKDFAP